jgi:hypothetical protein
MGYQVASCELIIIWTHKAEFHYKTKMEYMELGHKTYITDHSSI